jgi:hypothetical protein
MSSGYLPLFGIEVSALPDGFPVDVYRLLIPDVALHHIAHLAFSMNMKMPEVVHPAVFEQTRHPGSSSTTPGTPIIKAQLHDVGLWDKPPLMKGSSHPVVGSAGAVRRLFAAMHARIEVALAAFLTT